MVMILKNALKMKTKRIIKMIADNIMSAFITCLCIIFISYLISMFHDGDNLR